MSDALRQAQGDIMQQIVKLLSMIITISNKILLILHCPPEPVEGLSYKDSSTLSASLILFLRSNELEYEVLVKNVVRMSVTGWLNRG